MIPLLRARSMTDRDRVSAPRAPSASFLASSSRSRRMCVCRALRRERLMVLRRRFFRMFLTADLMRATTSSSIPLALREAESPQALARDAGLLGPREGADDVLQL